MRAAEHADHARVRQPPLDAPEELVPLVLRRRRSERRDLRALRIDLPDDVLDRAVLAGGVEPLQHEQKAALSTGAAVRVEHLLQLTQPRRELRLQLRACRLAAAVDRGSRTGVNRPDVETRGWHAEDFGHRASLGHESPLSDSNRRPPVYKTGALTN